MYRLWDIIHLGETIQRVLCKSQTTQFFTMITTALNCQIRIGEEGEEEVKAAVATFSEAKHLRRKNGK